MCIYIYIYIPDKGVNDMIHQTIIYVHNDKQMDKYILST